MRAMTQILRPGASVALYVVVSLPLVKQNMKATGSHPAGPKIAQEVQP